MSDLVDFLKGQMAGFGEVTARPMFGGTGLYKDGVMFALVAGGTLYLKASAATEADFQAEGLAPFSYQTQDGRRTLTSYWQAPERCLDEADEMTLWCGKAHMAARGPRERGH